jgi:hypothetical protein
MDLKRLFLCEIVAYCVSTFCEERSTSAQDFPLQCVVLTLPALLGSIDVG